MSNLSVFSEQFDGQEVRITSDGAVSVLDAIAAVMKVKNPSKTWKDLQVNYPEVLTFSYDFKFPGRGQKKTPVVDEEGLNQLFMLLPGKNAAEFRKWASSILARYRRGDASLAEEVIDRNNNPEDLKRIELRAKTKRTNKLLNSAIASHGGDCYRVVANINNVAVTGKTARELKAIRQVKQTRDGLNHLELTMIAAAEELESSGIEARGARGNREIINIAKDVGDDISRLMHKYTR